MKIHIVVSSFGREMALQKRIFINGTRWSLALLYGILKQVKDDGGIGEELKKRGCKAIP